MIFNVTQVVDENGAARYKRTCVDGKQVTLQVMLQEFDSEAKYSDLHPSVTS